MNKSPFFVKFTQREKRKELIKIFMPRRQILLSHDIAYYNDSKMPVIVKHTIVLCTTRKKNVAMVNFVAVPNFCPHMPSQLHSG